MRWSEKAHLQNLGWDMKVGSRGQLEEQKRRIFCAERGALRGVWVWCL